MWGVSGFGVRVMVRVSGFRFGLGQGQVSGLGEGGGNALLDGVLVKRFGVIDVELVALLHHLER